MFYTLFLTSESNQQNIMAIAASVGNDLNHLNEKHDDNGCNIWHAKFYCASFTHTQDVSLIFWNKSISNMPLNVIKERKIKLSAKKIYQIIHKMQHFLQNFIRLLISNNTTIQYNAVTQINRQLEQTICSIVRRRNPNLSL